MVRRPMKWLDFPLFRKKAIISFHSRASFLISNIGCFVDGTYIKISGRARTGGKYSAPTKNKKRLFFLHNINNIPQSKISHVLSKMDILFLHRAVARSTKKIVSPSSAHSTLQSLHSVFSVPFPFFFLPFFPL